MLDLVFVGLGVILAGFLVIFLAMTKSGDPSKEDEKHDQVRGGGVILIGPIPIVFGSDAKWASVAVVLAIVLIIVILFSGVLVRQ
jgi:uncharacterized protein (TIGR00304 family)